MRFRRRKRCRNLSPSPHPSYRGRQCQLAPDHDGSCRISIGPYKHYWNQQFYERRGLALRKEDDA
jgi:hypothetical protein